MTCRKTRYSSRSATTDDQAQRPLPSDAAGHRHGWPVRHPQVGTAMRPPLSDDHGRLKSRLRPMRGLKQLRCTRVICAGHAFVQNMRRGHYELGSARMPTRNIGSRRPSPNSPTPFNLTPQRLALPPSRQRNNARRQARPATPIDSWTPIRFMASPSCSTPSGGKSGQANSIRATPSAKVPWPLPANFAEPSIQRRSKDDQCQ
jgi:hypothetical protein